MSSSSQPGGVSIFAIDPGTGTGWAWCCVGWKELKGLGAEGAVLRAKERSLSGRVPSKGLGDVRFRMGEINTMQGDIETAQDCLIQAMVCSHMGNRVSNGRVPNLTHVVIEDFSFREKTKSRHLLTPIRVGAAFEAFMVREHELRYTEISYQMPAEKSSVTDERQKRWGLWFPGKKDANVAIKHMIVKLRKLA